MCACDGSQSADSLLHRVMSKLSGKKQNSSKVDRSFIHILELHLSIYKLRAAARLTTIST